jgi:hypothetical protein
METVITIKAGTLSQAAEKLLEHKDLRSYIEFCVRDFVDVKELTASKLLEIIPKTENESNALILVPDNEIMFSRLKKNNSDLRDVTQFDNKWLGIIGE